MENNLQDVDLDGPSEVELTDPEVLELFTNGLISRAEADVFDLIADFNDGDEQGTCCSA